MASAGLDWPSDLVAYKRTPDFTESSVPAGLLRAHSTKAGVWAKIHVLSGKLLFRDLHAKTEQWLSPGIYPIIHPQAEHEVEPCEGTSFFVEFHQKTTAP